jgi:GDP-4-dehydro-6-deoxy-D-mannose reductase
LSWTRHDVHADNTGERQVDIRLASEVDAAVADFRPTHVVHLAAQSHVPTSFRDPEGTWQVNVMGTLHLLEAVRRYAPEAAVLFVGSSEVYGRSFQIGTPLPETALLQPQNPYAASKAAADLMCGQYAGQGLRTIRLRPFNHIGAGQSEDFVASAFAAQIARIEAGWQEPVLRVGNLDAQRDFLDVDDVVRAYVLAMEKSRDLSPGVVLNLCSGTPRRIRDLLDMLLEETHASIRVETDPARMRPSDTPYAVGSADAAMSYLGWSPSIPLKDTVRALLDDWRRVVRSATV